MLAELLTMDFGPGGGTDQAGLFTIPGAINDGALRPPALAEQFAHGAGFFHGRNLAGEGIFRAVYPAVVMIAAQDPFVRLARAGDARDDVVDGLEAPVGLHNQVHLRGTRAEVVGHGQGAASGFWSHGAGESGEQRLRIGVGEWQHGNLGDAGSVCGGVVRGGGIAAVEPERIAGKRAGKIFHAAALDAVGRAHGAGGKDVVHKIAVVARIGIDEAADGAMVRGEFGLDAAPDAAVAGDGDCAFYGDAHAFEFLVIVGAAVVDVDEGAGDVAIGGVDVIGGELFALLRGGGIDGDVGLFQLGGEAGGRGELDHAALGRGIEHVEGFDVGVPTPFLELGENPLGIVFVVG